MLDVSAEWKRSVILDDNRQYLAYADVVLADGKKLSLDNTKFWNGGFSVNDSTSAQGTFTVGALVASKLTIKINNIYDDYSEYDFTDARATAYIAKQLESGLEKIKIGEFTISSTSYDGSIITLTCLDNVNKFNKAYNSNLAYPATLYEIVRNACLDCGVPFTMARFPNSDYTVQTKPDANNTYGRVIAYALQICGCFGKCDHNGTLAIGWYDLSLFSERNYTGGTFSTTTTPYSDGDTLNGGTFAYTDGDSVDGGSYTERQEYHNIYGSKEFKVDTDDVVITGVKVVVTSQESANKDVEYLSGKTGYVIAINNNPLVGADQAKAVANFVYSRIGGMRFRPFSGSFLSDPTIESGDTAIVNDRKGNAYNTFISNRTFSLGNNTTISCDAESASRNSADKYTADTKAIVEARKTTQKQLSAYDEHMQLLTMLMAQSVGLFKTEQKQDDGSTIYIMHNKADLASSQIQWKMTANGMAVSSDYGKTWNAGVDSSGNAVFNVMSAIGINFDWAHGGTLTLGGENNVNGKQYVKDAKGKTLVTLDNKGITLDSSVKIAWDNVADSTAKVTQITKDTVTTSYVNALKVKAGSVDAENITGTTITGKSFVSGSITCGDNNSPGKSYFSVDAEGNVTMNGVNRVKSDLVLENNSWTGEGYLKFKNIGKNGEDNGYGSTIIGFESISTSRCSVSMLDATGNVAGLRFQENNKGYAMCGSNTGHTYHCSWDETALWFEVDDTWVWNSSDKRLKKNIESVSNDYIDAIGAVDLIQYNLNRKNYSDKELYFGALAQDVVTQLEQRGLTDDGLKLLSKQKVSDNDNTLYYGMDYEQFLVLRIAHDEKRIKELESKIDKLLNRQ
nr:MAG TPA: endosialidase chaperone [Bacteriophage sp.]